MTDEIITPLGNEKPPTTLTCWLTEADRKMMIKRDEKERERKRLAKLPKPKPVRSVWKPRTKRSWYVCSSKKRIGFINSFYYSRKRRPMKKFSYDMPDNTLSAFARSIMGITRHE